ncbi:DUF2797 domain-containing protein [Halosquirtibacter xylanolyticus]|uniref:DUF2797 domain-containing protein n=1 Tax=Halosquirtibacter xylanolyticus TaxID=3374599 RepID=UPI0037479479|nr:DUF2797 domain-containing protein [Prolixibacteraceae bacterium]
MKVMNGDPIQYELVLSDKTIPLNHSIGQHVSFHFKGQINCVDCGKKTKKSFNQGFCYNCYLNSPMSDPSIINPELSRAQWGEARDIEWSVKHDLIPHYVYLALSSDVKVGVTRHHQIPTRWIDQGASAASILCETPNRHIAGIIETVLKKHYTDKTSWMKMLKNEVASIDKLETELKLAGQYLPIELQRYIVQNSDIQLLNYPVEEYPTKVQSLSFDKTPIIEGVIKGIKGQYIIFEHGVLNIRRHSGYMVEVDI